MRLGRDTALLHVGACVALRDIAWHCVCDASDRSTRSYRLGSSCSGMQEYTCHVDSPTRALAEETTTELDVEQTSAASRLCLRREVKACDGLSQ